MTIEKAFGILSNGLVNAPSEHEWCEAFKTAIDTMRKYQKLERVLDKIRADITDCIKALDDVEKFNIYLPNEITGRRLTYQQCLEFIDKYKGENYGNAERDSDQDNRRDSDRDGRTEGSARAGHGSFKKI